ncbi:hypothetical protein ZOSMA_1G00920 [Zostera marina]|uniref:Uncharacterized protein n=1 Tax=Zostera marina TaxID=29655 RepID=A0A0K9PME1_ZOSMR|nr:hypothetical protein ZOSMA_1G00920 [Zostera marina]
MVRALRAQLRVWREGLPISQQLVRSTLDLTCVLENPASLMTRLTLLQLYLDSKQRLLLGLYRTFPLVR